jgi:putative transposase
MNSQSQSPNQEQPSSVQVAPKPKKSTKGKKRTYLPAGFAPIIGFDLEKYILDANLCPAAEAYLREAIIAPSRQLSGYCSHTIHYPCIKFALSLKNESRNIEYPWSLTMIYRMDALLVLEQPPKIKIVVPGKRGWTTYTPDLLVITTTGIEIWEARPSARLANQCLDTPHIYQHDGETDSYHSQPIKDYFKTLGFAYAIASEKNIHPGFCQAVIFLHQYILGYPQNPITPEEKSTFIQFVRQHSGLRLNEIPWPDTTRRTELALYFLARAEVFTSLSDADFQNPAALRLYATAQDEKAFHQYLEQSRPRPTSLDDLGYKLKQGSLIEIGEKDYIITRLTSKMVRLKCGEAEQDISYQALLDLKPRIGGFYNAEKTYEKRYQESPMEYRLTQEVRRQRMAPYIIGGNLEGQTPEDRTVRRWLQENKEALAAGISPDEAAFPKFYKCGRTPLKWDDDIEEEFQECVSECILNPKDTTVAWVAKQLVAKFGIKRAPHIRAIYRRCEKPNLDPHTRNIKSRGKRAASITQPFYGDSPTIGSPHGQRAWQRAHIDSSLMDIRHPDDPRSHLAKMIDSYTGKEIGRHLCAHSPNELTIRELLLDCVARHGTLPAEISCDFGSEHRTTWLRKTMVSLNVILDIRPKADSRKGGPVESSFSADCKELIHNLAGQTDLMKRARIVTKAVDPDQFATWSKDDFEALLFEYFELRNDLPRSGKPSPNSIELACREKFGPPPIPMPSVEKLGELLLPFVKGITRTVSPRGIIRCNNHSYGVKGEQNDLRRYAGSDLAVRWIPNNPDMIYAYSQKSRTGIPCDRLDCTGPAPDIIEIANSHDTAKFKTSHPTLTTKEAVTTIKAEFVERAVSKEKELKKAKNEKKIIPFNKSDEESDHNIPVFNFR